MSLLLKGVQCQYGHPTEYKRARKHTPKASKGVVRAVMATWVAQRQVEVEVRCTGRGTQKMSEEAN